MDKPRKQFLTPPPSPFASLIGGSQFPLTQRPVLIASAATVTSSFAASQKDAAKCEPSATWNEKACRNSIAAMIESDMEKRGNGESFIGTFVRLAWHSAGTYSKEDNSGGSSGGLMRFDPEKSWGANAGLGVAREAMEQIKKDHPEATYGDLYTLAGVVAVEEAGGPKIPWRPGRKNKDCGGCSPPDGRLPDADKGCPAATTKHVREIFNRMGFNDREMVALIGAHALGRCHENASGFWGPWTFAENTMSNEYFRLLVEEPWTKKTKHNGRKWTGPDQYEDKTGKLMMLPSDLVLIQDPEFRKIVEEYAKNEDVFFKDFSKAFSRLLELGVEFPKPWYQFW